MKTITKKLSVSFLYALIIGLSITAFSCKKDDAAAALNPADQIVGKWKLTSLQNNGLPASTFQSYQTAFNNGQLKSLYEFKADKSYCIDSKCYTNTTYSISGNQLDCDKLSGTISFSSNTLSVKSDDTGLIFIFTKQ